MNASRRSSQRRELVDEEYRHVYANSFLDSYIATQIKVLREQRGWTQAQLAQRAGMKQSRISLLEDVEYYRWSVSTLRRLAKAFDVTLSVRLQSFGETLSLLDRFSRESLEAASFEHDPYFVGTAEQLSDWCAEDFSVEETQWLRPDESETKQSDNCVTEFPTALSFVEVSI